MTDNTFDDAEKFLLSRGYSKFSLHPSLRSREVCLYQKKVREGDPITDEGELFFNFGRYDPDRNNDTFRLEGSCHIQRDGLSLSVGIYGFKATDIATLLDCIESEWFAIADRKVAP